MTTPTLVWDNHVCLPLRPDDLRFRADLVRHRAAGFNVLVVNIGCGRTVLAEVLALLESFERWVAVHADRYAIPRDLRELETIVAGGRTALLFDLEGSDALLEAPERLPELARRGLRWSLLVYNEQNALGSGCHVAEDLGLTRRGRELVRRLEGAGIVPCAAHAGARTARELLEFAEKPAIISHANAAGLVPHPRNVGDDLAALCAERGGVIGLTGVGLFLGSATAEPAAICRHARYLADRIGAAHVGLALDYVYDGDELRTMLAASQHMFPPEYGYTPDIVFAAPERLADLRGELAAAFAASEVTAILGGNWHRVAAACWDA